VAKGRSLSHAHTHASHASHAAAVMHLQHSRPMPRLCHPRRPAPSRTCPRWVRTAGSDLTTARRSLRRHPWDCKWPTEPCRPTRNILTPT
jgi:hypothetical protein